MHTSIISLPLVILNSGEMIDLVVSTSSSYLVYCPVLKTLLKTRKPAVISVKYITFYMSLSNFPQFLNTYSPKYFCPPSFHAISAKPP